MSDDFAADRRRTHEDEYFRKKDRELVEKIRLAAEAEALRRGLSERTGIDDPALVDELQAMGFTIETAVLLPLVPIVEMAWAEGGVSPAERALVMQLARSRGVQPGGAADKQLAQWLDHRPSPDVFARALRLASAIVGSATRLELGADAIIKYCEDIAAASGGLFGIGRVSADERAALAKIAAALKGRAQGT